MTVATGSDPRARKMTVFGALAWSLTLLFARILCAGATEAAREGAIHDLVNLAACQVLATSLVLFAIARVYAPTSSLRAALGVRRFPAIHAPLAAVAGVGLAPVLETLNELVARRWPYDPETAAATQALFEHSSRLTIVIGGLVVPAIAQEIFYRGALFEQLVRTEGAALVVAATAILSCPPPPDPQAMPAALILGLALGWIRARSGSVWPPLVAVLAGSAVDAFPILKGVDLSADVVYPPAWIGCGAAAAAVALAAFAWRPRSVR
jgi:membrane protease YdiL (CAAX protease family)